jgi:hypothetical protein
VFDVFRFAWFAVRTFFGIIALVLVMRGALWTLGKLHSAAMAHAKPAAVTYRVPASSVSVTARQSLNASRAAIECTELQVHAHACTPARTN